MASSSEAQEGAQLTRCAWVGNDPLYQAYHDEEWGVPLFDDRGLFELLMLESFQAGLSWITILRKREAFREAFAGFQPERIAEFAEEDVARLLADPGIVRHRGKIESTIAGARIWCTMMSEANGFSRFLWSFVDGTPKRNSWRSMAEVPASTPTSEAMSKALKKKGFRFCGPTICYAFMQATGMVNDHTVDCFCYNAMDK